MTLPDKITLSRIILSPVFFIVFYILQHWQVPALPFIIILWILGAVIELSDLFDGMIARKTGQTTDLGKLLDPFADVFSRLTYFLCFVMAGIMPFWIFLIILYRELGISFVRLYLSVKKVIMGAGIAGKIKAWFYAVAGISGLLCFSFDKLLTKKTLYDNFMIPTMIVFGGAALMALISFIGYVAGINKKIEKIDTGY